jgi:integrase
LRHGGSCARSHALARRGFEARHFLGGEVLPGAALGIGKPPRRDFPIFSGWPLPFRHATLILLAYRHGLRVSELCSLRWDMLDLSQGRFHVTRRKNGRPSVHLLRGSEIRALRRLQREQVPASIYVFTTERRGPMTPATFRKLLSNLGAAAGLPFPVHPHMLRHACGFALANGKHDTRAIQEWLGHRNIQHTTRYTELTTHRFKDFWQRED